MKKVKKLVASVMATCLILGTGIYSFKSINSGVKVLATENKGKNFSVPTYVYGAGLKGEEINKTAQALGIQSLEGMTVVPITGSELDKFIGQGRTITPDSEMISSVAVVKEKDGSGIEVVITTPQNISQIQKFQYENAAITAGIKDVYVAVGSIRRVTGESALAGIYKAYELNNVALDKDRMEVAQKELEVTNKLIQDKVKESQENTTTVENTKTTENKEVSTKAIGNTTTIAKKIINGSNNTNSNNNNNNSNNVDSNNNNSNSNNVNSGNNSNNNNNNNNNVTNIQNNINQVMIDIKSELGSKALAGTNVTQEEIVKIVEEKLKENKVEGFTEAQLAQLSEFFKDYNAKVAKKAAEDGTSQKQLEKLSEKVSSNTVNREVFDGIYAKIMGGASKTNENITTSTETKKDEQDKDDKKETTVVEETTTTSNVRIIGNGTTTKAQEDNSTTKEVVKETTKEEVKGEEKVTTTDSDKVTTRAIKSNDEEKTTTTTEESNKTTMENKATTVPSTNVKIDENGIASYEGFNNRTLEEVGFIKSDLPSEIKYLLVNFDSKEISYYKALENIKVNDINEDAIRNIESNNEFITAMAEDYLDIFKENSNVIYKNGENGNAIKQTINLKGTKLQYLNLSSLIEKIKSSNGLSTYGTLELAPRLLLNEYVNLGEAVSDKSSRYLLDLMAKEVNLNENKATIVDLGEGVLIFTIDNGEAKVWYVDKKANLNVDLFNSPEYLIRIFQNGSFEETQTTIENKQTTMENNSKPN